MRGQPITELNAGLRTFTEDLRSVAQAITAGSEGAKRGADDAVKSVTPLEKAEQVLRRDLEQVEQLGETSFLLRVVLQNAGWLPTNVSQKALDRQAARELEVELELPDGAKLVGGEMKTTAGQLQGRVEKRSTTWWGNDESTTDLAKLEWVIEAPAGTEIGLEARHQRAGTIRERVKLQ